MFNDGCIGIFFAMLIILFYWKKMWKIKILPNLPRYLSCLFGFQKLLRLIQNWRNGLNACLQFDLKCETVKYRIQNFTDSSDNHWQQLWVKVRTRRFCVSLPFPLLTVLKNNQENLPQGMLWVRNIV